MKLCKKNSLGKCLIYNRQNRKKLLTNTELQIILIGTAAGMNYLNSKSIMHRDLKPDNILLDEFNRPIITDFGLAKHYLGGLDQTPNIGTPTHEAPEVIEAKNYNCKVDVYSFGVLMYEVVSGFEPYNKVPSFKLLNDVAKGFRPKLDVPMKESFRNLIRSCLEQNPEKRPEFNDIVKLIAFDKNFYLDGVDESIVLHYVVDVLKYDY